MPQKESGPLVLNMSNRIPVAADEENIFTVPNDTSSSGNPISLLKGDIKETSISMAPEARNTATAHISPAREGKTPITVLSPCTAPSVKTENISVLEKNPHNIIIMKIKGSII